MAHDRVTVVERPVVEEDPYITTHRLFTVTIPTIRNPISTTITSYPTVVEDWIRRLESNIDANVLEIIVSLSINSLTHDRAATLQLCLKDTCLIFQIKNSSTVPPILNTFLNRQEYIFVAYDDRHFFMERLHNASHALRLDDNWVVLDLRSAFEDFNLSLTAIVMETLGIDLTRCLDLGVIDSNWEASILNSDQISYATTMAYVLWDIGDQILEDIRIYNRVVTITIPTVNNTVVYPITTDVTSNPTAVEQWINGTLDLFRDGDNNKLKLSIGINLTNDDRAATLQFCFRNHCLIFHLQRTTAVPPIVNDFLNDNRNTFVAFKNRGFFVNRLHNVSHIFHLDNDWPFLDLRRLFTGRNPTLESLALGTLGIDFRAFLDLGIRYSDWEVPQLTPSQILYTTTIAYVLWAIGDRMVRN